MYSDITRMSGDVASDKHWSYIEGLSTEDVRWTASDFLTSVPTWTTVLQVTYKVYLQISTGIVSSLECRESLEQTEAFHKE